MDILVVVITYKRPHMLERLLKSLELAGYPHEVLVVDNDPLGSALLTAERAKARYVVEKEPGISAARNRGIAESSSYDAIVFVDDDEYVVPGWLSALVAIQQKTRAGAVFGPVISELPRTVPRWIDHGGFFMRPRYSDGSKPRWPATGNVLITLSALAMLDVPRFSNLFSLTGGSDTEFFWRLELTGSRMVWCDGAVAYEEVPAERATAKWLWRRNIRLGNVSARMLVLKGKSKHLIFIASIVRILAASPLALYRLMRREPWGASLANLPKGIGMIEALRGNLTAEYQRSKTTGS
ncbi:glycosyltransferase family 2 protein [Leucobacter sp. USHLN154]|uniref:glycosyltransferase family 2 protein n=1 Tax=Leucobacter sp. USHLN154 TaxID=3081269 RepID=UPI003017A61D